MDEETQLVDLWRLRWQKLVPITTLTVDTNINIIRQGDPDEQRWLTKGGAHGSITICLSVECSLSKHHSTRDSSALALSFAAQAEFVVAN